MDDKLKVFWNLDMLVKMCRSKSDGPSLRIEEEEILDKIETCRLEIEEIRIQSEEDIYDTSAEMADRNIEIITKKQLQTLKTTLDVGVVVEKKQESSLKIRKLTPLECWRLMGFDDSDFYKAQGAGISNTQLYKQAGNSIVVNVLERIFINLFKGE